MTERSCGEALSFLLKEHGVDIIFGMPGVHTLELYKTIDEAGLRHIGVRHEQGAGFMADGFARASGRPGVCLLISGPGLTNAATPIGQAYSDSVPMLVVTAMNARHNIGLDRGALHEITDQAATAAPIAGSSVVAWEASQVDVHLTRAFASFAANRPRPAVISIPLDVLDSPLGTVPPRSQLPCAPSPARQSIDAAVKIIETAKCPLILVGGGAIDADRELITLAEKTGAIVVTTIAAKGVFPSFHRQSLGSTLQQIATRRAMSAADLIIAVGTEIAEPDLYLVTSNDDDGADITPDRLDLHGKLVRIDLDSGVVVRDYPADVAIVGDAGASLQAITAQLDKTSNIDQLGAAKRVRDLNEASSHNERSNYNAVLSALRAALPADGQVFADMCKIAYAGCMSFPAQQPRCWHFPNGYGTLGYALPAAIGGKLACPDRATAVLVGDGGIMFTIAELATAVENKLPIAIILWDNEALGEIRDGMRARQMSEIAVQPLNPDFEPLIKSFGARYAAPDKLDDVEPAIATAFAADCPTVIHIREGILFPET